MNFKNFIFLLVLAGCVLSIPSGEDLQQLAAAMTPAPVLVIDAGHGGPDGGAKAADGTLEKELNLQIAKALQTEAERLGFTVVMTREMDTGLYASQTETTKWKKLEDLQARRELVEQAGADLLVSVHLNSFWSDTSVRGAQVFYPKQDGSAAAEASKTLASLVQKSLTEGLEDGSNRVEMERKDLYLFDDLTCPSILIECGFLSNGYDVEKLKKPEYQRRFSQYIMAAVRKYFD